jgi:putative aldouronate transport system permease protein
MSKRKRTPLSIVILMLLFSFTCIYPFYYVLILSFNDAIDANLGGIYFWPRVFTMANYEQVFKNPYLLNSFRISVLRVCIATIIVPILNSLYGYALIKRDLMGRRFFNILPIIPMYVSGGLIPYFFVLKELRLIDTFSVYIIPVLYVPFNILVFRSFFQDLPSSLREAAIIDGCSEFNVYSKIIFPLSLPVMATIALFTAVGHWNDWYVAQAFVTNPDKWPLQTILLQIIRSQNISFGGMTIDDVVEISKRRVTPESIKLTMIIVCTVPILVLYPFLQKYFIKGVMIGAVKE